MIRLVLVWHLWRYYSQLKLGIHDIIFSSSSVFETLFFYSNSFFERLLIMVIRPIYVWCLWYENIHDYDFKFQMVRAFYYYYFFLNASIGLMGAHIGLFTFSYIFWSYGGPIMLKIVMCVFILIIRLFTFSIWSFIPSFPFFPDLDYWVSVDLVLILHSCTLFWCRFELVTTINIY